GFFVFFGFLAFLPGDAFFVFSGFFPASEPLGVVRSLGDAWDPWGAAGAVRWLAAVWDVPGVRVAGACRSPNGVRRCWDAAVATPPARTSSRSPASAALTPIRRGSGTRRDLGTRAGRPDRAARKA